MGISACKGKKEPLYNKNIKQSVTLSHLKNFPQYYSKGLNTKRNNTNKVLLLAKLYTVLQVFIIGVASTIGDFVGITFVGVKWWDKWKTYTFFDEATGRFAKECFNEAFYPGEVSNVDIVDDYSKYYLRPDDPQYLRSPLKPTLRENIDYKILNKKCGRTIYKLFDGKGIIRNITKSKRGLVPIVYPPLVLAKFKYR